MGNVTVIGVFTRRRFQTGTKRTTSGILAGIGGTDIVVVTDEDSSVEATSCGVAESFSTFGGEDTSISIICMSAMFTLRLAAICVAYIRGTSISIVTLGTVRADRYATRGRYTGEGCIDRKRESTERTWSSSKS